MGDDGFDSSILGGGSDGGAMEIFDSNFACTNCVLSNNVTNDDGGFLDAVNSDVSACVSQSYAIFSLA